ncbi:MAG: hypothetical protein ACLP4V_05695 [Methylocella sp.]
MIRDEDVDVYLDLNTRDYGGFVSRADRLLQKKLNLPAGYSLKWSGEYEFEARQGAVKDHSTDRLPCDLYAAVYGVPIRDRSTHSDLSDALCDDGRPVSSVVPWLQFSVAVWVGYIALFGISVETGVVMVVYLHEALDRRLAAGSVLQRVDIDAGHHRRRRPPN